MMLQIAEDVMLGSLSVLMVVLTIGSIVGFVYLIKLLKEM